MLVITLGILPQLGFSQIFFLEKSIENEPEKIQFSSEAFEKIDFGEIRWNQISEDLSLRIENLEIDKNSFKLSTKTAGSFKQIIEPLLKPKAIDRLRFSSPSFTEIDYKYLDNKNGLVGNKIIDIESDDDLSIWACTENAIMHLDGGVINVYDHRQNIPDCQITDMLLSKKGKTLVSSFGDGFFAIGDTTICQVSKKTGFISNHILKMVELNDLIFASTYDHGIIEISDSIYLKYEFGLNPFEIVTYLDTAAGALIFGTSEGAFGKIHKNQVELFRIPEISNLIKKILYHSGTYYILTDKQEVFNVAQNGAHKLIFNEPIQQLACKAHDELWAFGNDHIYLLKNNELVRYFGHNKHYELLEINDIEIDAESNFWLASENSGIVLICPNQFQSLPIHIRTISSQARLSFHDHEGNYYTQAEGGGLIKIDSNNITFKFSHPSLRQLGGMVEWREKLFIASYDGLFCIENNRLIKYEVSRSRGLNSQLHVAKFRDNLLISNYNHAVILFDGNRFLASDQLGFLVNKSLVISAENTILASSSDGIIELIFRENDTLALWNKSQKTIDNIRINDLSFDGKSNLIACTSRGLIWARNQKTDTIQANDNLSQAFVNAVYDEKLDVFWVSTSNELYQLKVNESVFDLTLVPGLQSFQGELKKGVLTINPNHDLVFPMNGQLITYNHDALTIISRNYPIRFTEIQVNGKPYLLDGKNKFSRSSIKRFGFPESIVLEPDADNLIFKFDITNWSVPDNLKFQYRLIGLNDVWSEPSDNSSIIFNRIPFGVYTLEIRVADEFEGINFQNVKLKIEVKRHFYESPVFLILILLISALFIFTLLRVFSNFTLDSLSSYTNLGNLTQNVRILSVLSMLLFPVVSYFGSVIFRLYPVDWLFIWLIVMVSFLGMAYTFVNNPDERKLKIIPVVSYISVYSLFTVMCYKVGLSFHLGLELATLILFSKFILQNTRNVIIFIIYVIVINVLLTFQFPIEAQALSYMYASLAICIIILAALILIEGSDINKLSFANRVLESSSLFVVVCNIHGKVIYLNDRVTELLETTEYEAMGQRFWNLIGLEHDEIIQKKAVIKATINSGKTYTYDSQVKVKNKAYNFRWNDYVLDNKYLIEIGQDITSSVELEREVETLVKIATSVNNGVVILNENAEINWCNRSFEKLTGLQLSKVKDQKIRSLLKYHDEENQDNDENYVPFYQSKEIELLNANMDRIWVLINTTINKDNASGETQYIEVWTDITQQKLLQADYKFIIENATDVLYTCNYKGYFTFVSESMTTQFKYPKDYLIGRHVSDLVALEHMTAVNEFYAAQLNQRIEETYFEFKIKLYNGNEIWVGQNVKAIFEEGSTTRIKAFQAIARDITVNKQYEENLATLSLVAQRSNNFILILDKDLKISWTNEAFLRFFEYRLDEVIGKNPGDLLNGPKTDMKVVQSASKKLMDRKSVRTEVVNYTKSGREVWIQMTIDPVVEGNNVRYIAVEHDITERIEGEHIIKQQTQDILDSLHYSSRIQGASLPDQGHIQNILEESFVFFKSKDIVSGDFYLVENVRLDAEQRKAPAFVVADCTGHGIPGAMLSLLCSSILKQAMTDPDINSPGEALDFARNELQRFFKTKDHANFRDGMDAAFGLIDHASKTIVYSGANRPLWIIRGDEVIEVKGDKQHVGFSDDAHSFTNHIVPFEYGDQIILFTDGITDQIGGDLGKRFMSKNLKTLLLTIKDLPSETQLQFIKESFDAWKGLYPQIDDVCIMGIKITPPKQ